MAAYPADLAFFSQKLANWSQNTVKLVPQTLPTAGPQDVVIFTLPENTLVRLDTLAICGDLVGIRTDGTNDQCIFPRHISSFVDMVSVEVNGVSIDSSCLGYNHLAKLRHDFRAGARRSRKAVLSLSQDYVSNAATNTNIARVGRSETATGKIGTFPEPATANSDLTSLTGMNAYPFSLTDFEGFLGCGKTIDTSLLGTVRILVRLAGTAILQGAGTPSYRMHDLRMLVNVCDLSDGLYFQSLASRIETAPLVIPFKRYLSFSGPVVTSSTSVRFSCSTQSLDAVFCMLLPAVLPAKSNLTSSNSVDNPSGELVNPFFRRLSIGVVSQQLDANSVLYPTFTCKLADCYHLLMNTLGTQKDIDTSCIPGLNLASWANDLSLFSYRFSHSPGLEWLSGLDSRGLALGLTWNIVGTSIGSGFSGGQPLIFAETTAHLLVGKFRSVTLVA